ncbi:MAG TPA: hypothetical protein PKW24_08185 [Clostridiales bacterium]|nr:hypothetical protein [Clostridiales bacterium]
MEKTNQPFSIRVAKNVELNKGLLLVAFGYAFCYMFMLDYCVEGMNIFYRWSTVSYSQFKHPVLFAIWIILCSLAFFLNIGYMRAKYKAPQKWISVLQYLGYFLLLLSMFVPTHRAPHETAGEYLRYYVHLFSALFFALADMACILGVFAYRREKDQRFKYWLYGGIAFSLSVAPLFIFKLSGFVENFPLLTMMVVLYILNYTKLMEKN